MAAVVAETKINEYTSTFSSNVDLKDDEMNPLEIRGECDIQVVYRDISLKEGNQHGKENGVFPLKHLETN